MQSFPDFKILTRFRLRSEKSISNASEYELDIMMLSIVPFDLTIFKLSSHPPPLILKKMRLSYE